MAKTKKEIKKIPVWNFTFNKEDCDSAAVMYANGDIKVIEYEKKTPANYTQRKAALMNEILNFLRSFDVTRIEVSLDEEEVEVEVEPQP